jgi:hypothetical protein
MLASRKLQMVCAVIFDGKARYVKGNFLAGSAGFLTLV